MPSRRIHTCIDTCVVSGHDVRVPAFDHMAVYEMFLVAQIDRRLQSQEAFRYESMRSCPPGHGIRTIELAWKQEYR